MAKAEGLLAATLEGDSLAPEDFAAIPGFAQIPPERHGKFPGAVARRTILAGQDIIRQGEHGTTAFYLVSGTADIFVSPPSPTARMERRSQGKGWFQNLTNLSNYLKGIPERSSQPTHPQSQALQAPQGNAVGTASAGDIVGELEALYALKEAKRPRPKYYPRAATVRAKTDVVILEMLPNYFNGVVVPSPAFKEKINKNYQRHAVEYPLRSAPILRGASPELLAQLCDRAKLADFEPGQVICRQGDPVTSFDLVRLGFVKLSETFPGGELVLAYLSRGSYFGELGLLPALRVRAQSPQPERSAECLVSISPVRVGRSQSSPDDLAIPWDEYISRTAHAELRLEGGSLRISRLASGKNPIRVDGKMLDTALVSPGQSFTLGETQFDVEVPKTAGTHPATCTAMDFVQLVRIPAADFQQIVESAPAAVGAIGEVAQGRRQLESQLLGRVQQVGFDDFLERGLMQGQNLLLLDLDKCTRCDECVKACAATHEGNTRLMRDGLRFENYLVATACRACMDPLCMTHCPVGAIRRKGASLDIVIEDWCIGCCNCAQDCPYGAINVMDLMPSPHAVVCDLCRDYSEPNCVRACPHEAAIRVEPKFFFARDLAGVPLPVKPAPPMPDTQTKILSGATSLLRGLPQLVIVNEGGAEDVPAGSYAKRFFLKVNGSTAFGREAGNDYVLDNSSVSKKQAVIDCFGSRYVLRNLSQTNGTLVNDAEVREVQLHPGDLIEMGEIKLRFTFGGRQ